jgi:hypothetical protein
MLETLEFAMVHGLLARAAWQMVQHLGCAEWSWCGNIMPHF